MPRQLRIQYPGAIYHVMNRGDRRELIFLDDTDRRRFLETLGEACGKTDWQAHAYCLMPNHFHLVLETPQANLVDGMKWLLGTCSVRFNRRHRLSGHLFGGRYKALIVDGSGDGYLRTVCEYVHLNPVRAKLIRPDQKLSDYAWSSYPYYLKPPHLRMPWLRVDRILGEMGILRDNAAGRRRFESQMEQRRAQETGQQWNALRRGWFFGDNSFRQELLEQARVQIGQSHFGEQRQETSEVKACRIVLEEMSRLGWNESELSQRRKGDRAKVRIASRLRAETTVSLKWIAQRLQMGSWSYVADRLRLLK